MVTDYYSGISRTLGIFGLSRKWLFYVKLSDRMAYTMKILGMV